MEIIENELKYCMFCGANIERVIDIRIRIKICNKCNVRFYGTHIYRIIFNMDNELYWFTFSTYLNKTYLYKRSNTKYHSKKLGEWNEILNITPSNINKKLKTILVFM